MCWHPGKKPSHQIPWISQTSPNFLDQWLEVANITDMMFSSSVVLFLVIAGPILSFETEADRQSYAAFLSWTFCDWAKTLPCHRMEYMKRILLTAKCTMKIFRAFRKQQCRVIGSTLSPVYPSMKMLTFGGKFNFVCRCIPGKWDHILRLFGRKVGGNCSVVLLRFLKPEKTAGGTVVFPNSFVSPAAGSRCFVAALPTGFLLGGLTLLTKACQSGKTLQNLPDASERCSRQSRQIHQVHTQQVAWQEMTRTQILAGFF